MRRFKVFEAFCGLSAGCFFLIRSAIGALANISGDVSPRGRAVCCSKHTNARPYCLLLVSLPGNYLQIYEAVKAERTQLQAGTLLLRGGLFFFFSKQGSGSINGYYRLIGLYWDPFEGGPGAKVGHVVAHSESVDFGRNLLQTELTAPLILPWGGSCCSCPAPLASQQRGEMFAARCQAESRKCAAPRTDKHAGK